MRIFHTSGNRTAFAVINVRLDQQGNKSDRLQICFFRRGWKQILSRMSPSQRVRTPSATITADMIYGLQSIDVGP